MNSENPYRKEVKIRKVPIETVLAILSNLYDNGVDFVDLHGIIGETEDNLGISFSKEYMDPEYAQQFDDLETDDLSKEEIKVKTKLSDDDIEQLL